MIIGKNEFWVYINTHNNRLLTRRTYLCISIFSVLKKNLMSVPKFANVPYSFHTELKNRINNYFEKTGKSTYGNFSLFLKAVYACCE